MATVSTENLLLTLQVDANQALTSLKKVDVQTKQTQAAFSGAGKNTKQFNAAIQNSSYQIADFAVQVGGGVSALKAFSQQAPQLLAGFGAFGAAAGAIVAILAAGANSLFKFGGAAESAGESLDGFRKKLAAIGSVNRGPISELTAALEKADEVTRAYIFTLLDLEKVKLSKSLSEAQADINEYVLGLTKYTKAIGVSVDGIGVGVSNLTGDAAKLEGIKENLKVDSDAAQSILNLLNAYDGTAEAAKVLATELGKLATAGKIDPALLEDFQGLIEVVDNLSGSLASAGPKLEEIAVSVEKLSLADSALLSETTDSLEGAIKAWDDYVAALEKSASAYKDSLDPMRAYNREVNKLGQFLSADLITLTEYNALVERLRNNLLQPIEVTVKPIDVKPAETELEGIKAILGEIQTESERWSDQFASQLVDGLKEGKLAFKDFANYVLEQLARIALSKALEPLFNSFGNFIGGLGGASAPVASGLIAAPVNDLPLSREVYSAQQMIVGIPRMSAPSSSGSPVNVNVYNQGSNEVEVSERKTTRGIEVDVLIKNAVKKGIASGDFDKVMATSYGARRMAF